MLQWNSKVLPGPVTVIGDTCSVLDDAWKLLADGEFSEWSSIVAQSQSQGRGQTRRQWHSPTGNLYAAIRLPAEEPFLSTAAAPALSSLIAVALESLGINVNIKWPNDLVVAHRGYAQKVGGILLEERNGSIIAGIGINLLHAPEPFLLRPNYAMRAGILELPESVKKWTSNGWKVSTDLNFTLVESLWVRLVSQMYFWYTKELPTPYFWRA